MWWDLTSSHQLGPVNSARLAAATLPVPTWHLEEVPLRINGELQYLWRAVDQQGVVLDIPAQDRRNAAAAKRFFKRVLTGLQYRPATSRSDRR